LSKPLVRELIDAGVQFGHRVSRWNPKMAPYILGKRGLVHIIDIKETLKGLLRAKKDLERKKPTRSKSEQYWTEGQFGTLIKAGRKATILSPDTPVALDVRPSRPPELSAVDNAHQKAAWCEGAAWMYAGASPIVRAGGWATALRFHTDWYKRTFVPEAYRHSIGVLDTAGNLILHIGRYGNFDSGSGANSKIPVGGDNIAMFMPRCISGTDNYLAFEDWGERIVVLKLNYQAEEVVGIGEVTSGK
jgi:hypothetical protein